MTRINVFICLYLAHVIPGASSLLQKAVPAKEDSVSSQLGLDPFEEELFRTTSVVRNSMFETRTQRRHVVWVHIVKSGGELFCEWAHKAGERVVEPSDLGCNWGRFNQHMHFTGLSGSDATCELRKTLIQQGNFTWEQIARQLDDGDICFDNFDYGITLRHPAERVTSFINYFQVSTQGWKAAIECLTKLDPEQCGLSIGFQGWNINHQYLLWNFDNFIVRMLGGYDIMHLPPGSINSSHFEFAKKRLTKFKAVIPLEGIMSERAQSVMDMTVGWHIEPQASHVNAHGHESVLSSEDVATFERINSFDMKLYRWFAKPYEGAS